MSIKAIIIDDEVLSVRALQAKLQDNCADVTVVASCHNVDDGINAIQEHKPDIVFLDVNMPNGDGFSLLERMDEITFEVIFTTAYDQYARRAFEVNALHFLLKPIKSDDLINAIQRYKDRSMQTSMKQIMSLVTHIRSGQKQTDRIALPFPAGLKFVEFKDIVRLSPENNYTCFYLVDGTSLVITKAFKEYEMLLEENSFIRIHHSHIINLAHVKEYKKATGTAVMTDNEQIEVSARKKATFLKSISRFMKV